jgi:hypothetical protein
MGKPSTGRTWIINFVLEPLLVQFQLARPDVYIVEQPGKAGCGTQAGGELCPLVKNGATNGHQES